jgi:hypothetical protein
MNNEKIQIQINKRSDSTEKIGYPSLIRELSIDIIIEFIDNFNIRRTLKCPTTSPMVFIDSINELAKRTLFDVIPGTLWHPAKINLRILNEGFMTITIYPPSVPLGELYCNMDITAHDKIREFLLKQVV